MPNETSDLITDLVTKWEDSVEIGLNLTPKEICFEHPELEQIVSEQITKLKRMRWLTSTWDSHASETLANGTVIANRFHIEGVLGSGGFGTVYRAMDTELLRSVALKIANPNRNDPDTLLTEARKAASLHHPHVITVYDVGRFEERVFIVSQLVEGRSLKDVAYSAKPTVSQIAQWMNQVAEALELAHKNGLVHRDLKPSNIIINTDQQAMVSDFGIAFHADEIDQIEPLTGTLPYMSPEQVQGESKLMGPKSDVFSFGVMLYELLSGKHPFLSKTSSETIPKINAAKPEPLTDAPVQLKSICEQCLSLRPEDRPSAAQIVVTLREFSEAGHRSSIFQAFLPLLLGSLFAAGLGGVAWWQLFPNNPNEESVTKSSETVVGEPKKELPQLEAKQDQPMTQSPVEQAKSVAPAASPRSGTVDLLPLIDPPKHTFRGLWKKTGGVLSVVSPDSVNESVGAALHIDYRPRGAYTLTLRARRSRNGGLIVPLVFSGRQFGAYLSGGWSGSKIPEARPMTVYPVDFFPTTDWHTVTVDVGPDRILCVGDSGAKLEWKADYASLDGRPFDMPDPLSLFLKAWGEFEIDTLTIEEHE
jgi:serine/threonine protein kinase